MNWLHTHTSFTHYYTIDTFHYGAFNFGLISNVQHELLCIYTRLFQYYLINIELGKMSSFSWDNNMYFILPQTNKVHGNYAWMQVY